MIPYPYTDAFILTDDVFTLYGGSAIKGQEGQRNAAFYIAERLVTSHLRTYLQPTVVTGTYLWPGFSQPLVLEHKHINSVLDVTAISADGSCNCTLREDPACAYLLESEFGYLYIKTTGSGSQVGCGCGYFTPHQARIAYNAGLSTGTSTSPDILLALSTVADIILNEISTPSGNEAPGAHGIIRWASQGYTEERMPLINTVLGNNPRANFAANLLDQSAGGKRALRLP